MTSQPQPQSGPRRSGRQVRRKASWPIWLIAGLIAALAAAVVVFFVSRSGPQRIPANGMGEIKGGQTISIDMSVYGYKEPVVVKYEGYSAGFTLISHPAPQVVSPDEANTIRADIILAAPGFVSQNILWDGRWLFSSTETQGHATTLGAYKAPVTITGP